MATKLDGAAACTSTYASRLAAPPPVGWLGRRAKAGRGGLGRKSRPFFY